MRNAFFRMPLPSAVTLLSFIILQVARCQSYSRDIDPLKERPRKKNKDKWLQENAGSAEILRIAADDKKALPEEFSLFVKYKNRKGKSFARKASNTFERLPKHPIVSIEAKNKDALRSLLDDPNIDFVEVNHKMHALQQLDHSTVSLSPEERNRRLMQLVGYGIKMVQADQMWDIPRTSHQEKDMTICVIDSGMAFGHPDLPTEGVTGTSTGMGDWKVDEYGHGSHCVGTIAALGNNNLGITGVLGNLTGFNLHISKALNKRGDGSEFLVLRALDGCITAGSKIISMSIGGPRVSDLTRDAFQKAYDAGALLLAASGNAGDTAYSFPASFSTVMSVSAVGEDEDIATFSQYNDQVEIAAPGVRILSTVPVSGGRYGIGSWSGTSMATPFVAGIAAMVWSHFEECTNHQIRNVLIRTARDLGESGCDHDTGFGIVQAKAAYDLLKREGCTAGGESPKPLSKGAVGGCQQDPFYTQPPTPSPTEFPCDEKVFMLNLTTDEWGEETSWTLMNSTKGVIETGSRYKANRTYATWLCLPLDSYVFTIEDTEGDGICCDYGNGSYSLYFDGELEKAGGEFGNMEVVKFGIKRSSGDVSSEDGSSPNTPIRTSSPSSIPTSPLNTESGKRPLRVPCIDDQAWVFKTKKGLEKRCRYLKSKSESRCKLVGKRANGDQASGFEACPSTCGSCPEPDTTSTVTLSPTLSLSQSRSSLTPSPTSQLTSLPTKQPTSNPTSRPTTTPTLSPTSQPTYSPTSATLSPTSWPTLSPTSGPTLPPTRPPTPSPTIQPTLEATNPPTNKPTSSPSRAPPIAAPTGTDSNAARSSTIKNESECHDDMDWVYTVKGNPKTCKYVAKAPNKRCQSYGVNGNGDSVSGVVACPLSCGVCSVSASQTTPAPSPSPIATPSSTEGPPCEDDKDWHASMFGHRMDCKYLETKSSSCWLPGRNAKGETQSGYDACPVACDTCPVSTIIPSTLCNVGYKAGIHLCDEDEAEMECNVYVELDGDSCDDFCAQQGGTCISASGVAGPGATCRTAHPSRCSYPSSRNVCKCSLSDSNVQSAAPPQVASSCNDLNGDSLLMCEESESQCSAYVRLHGKSCKDFCERQGASCVSAVESRGHTAKCKTSWPEDCSDRAYTSICTCELGGGGSTSRGTPPPPAAATQSFQRDDGMDIRLCEVKESEGTANVQLDGHSCNDFCRRRGAICIAAFESRSERSCSKSGTSFCSREHSSDRTCTCSFDTDQVTPATQPTGSISFWSGHTSRYHFPH